MFGPSAACPNTLVRKSLIAVLILIWGEERKWWTEREVLCQEFKRKYFTDNKTGPPLPSLVTTHKNILTWHWNILAEMLTLWYFVKKWDINLFICSVDQIHSSSFSKCWFNLNNISWYSVTNLSATFLLVFERQNPGSSDPDRRSFYTRRPQVGNVRQGSSFCRIEEASELN